ncbi:uncharacterized protein ACWYII_014798 [Salvelinus alpinus]
MPQLACQVHKTRLARQAPTPVFVLPAPYGTDSEIVGIGILRNLLLTDAGEFRVQNVHPEENGEGSKVKILESEPKENVLEQWSSPQYLSEYLDDRYYILSGPHVRCFTCTTNIDFGLCWDK